jgi:hypothetical protein
VSPTHTSREAVPANPRLERVAASGGAAQPDSRWAHLNAGRVTDPSKEDYDEARHPALLIEFDSPSLGLLCRIGASASWVVGGACTKGGAEVTASADIPPGCVNGAQLLLIYNFAGGAGLETFEVQEVRGTWVRGKVVKSPLWNKDAEIWINLTAVAQLWVGPQPTAQQQ